MCGRISGSQNRKLKSIRTCLLDTVVSQFLVNAHYFTRNCYFRFRIDLRVEEL